MNKIQREVFRHAFPQLCAEIKHVPLDFTAMHVPTRVHKEVKEVLPTGWINLRDTESYVKAPPDVNALACKAIIKMKANWIRWDQEHDVYVDYDKVEEDYTYYTDIESDGSVDADDPEEYEG